MLLNARIEEAQEIGVEGVRVCVRERERDRERQRGTEREGERKRVRLIAHNYCKS